MAKLTVEELKEACMEPRADHPGRRGLTGGCRGEADFTEHRGRIAKHKIKHTVEHNNGMPIRCPKKAARKRRKEIDARISELESEEEFEISLGPEDFGL